MRYVVGFLFDDSGQRVALMNKQRPEWQKGKLNGVGGKIEGIRLPLGPAMDGATGYVRPEWPAEAIERECLEEFGIEVKNWRQYAILETMGDTIYFLEVRNTQKIEELLQKMLRTKYSKGDEIPAVLRTIDVQFSKKVIPLLKWAIPMALERGIQLTTFASYSIRENTVPLQK